MQKILLLLSLLYFASSATLYCESHGSLDELPTDKNECFDREIKASADYAQCCFVHLKVGDNDVNVCCPAAKKAKKDDIKKLIEVYASQVEQMKGYEFKDYTCPNSSSYIKVGLLLLTLLLF